MWGYFRMPHFQKKYGLPKGLFRVHRSHRIHVWYIFLDLPQKSTIHVGKYNIYIWILFSGGKVTRKLFGGPFPGGVESYPEDSPEAEPPLIILAGCKDDIPRKVTVLLYCVLVLPQRLLMVVCAGIFFGGEKMIVVFTTHRYHIFFS